MRQRASASPWSGKLPGPLTQPSSTPVEVGPRAGGTGDVDEDRVTVRVVDQRVGVRPTAGLHRGDLLRVGHVGHVEDAHALEPERVGGGSATGAVGLRVGLLDRDEQQVAVDRRVPLATGADGRVDELGLVRGGDVVDVEPVEAPDERVRLVEREVRLGDGEVPEVVGVEEALGLRGAVEQLGAERRLTRIEQPRLEAHPRIVIRREGLRSGSGGGEQAREHRCCGHPPDRSVLELARELAPYVGFRSRVASSISVHAHARTGERLPATVRRRTPRPPPHEATR